MRLFVAIEPPEALHRSLKELQRTLPQEGLRLTPPEQLHLTVKFLGETDEVDRITATLSGIAGRTPPFPLTLGRCGTFPSRGAPRIVWCSLHCPSPALSQLHNHCETHLESLGFPIEKRSFTPHVTLARARKDGPSRRLLEWIEGLSPSRVEEEVRSFSLIQSVLTPHGARYSTLRVFHLRA